MAKGAEHPLQEAIDRVRDLIDGDRFISVAIGREAGQDCLIIGEGRSDEEDRAAIYSRLPGCPIKFVPGAPMRAEIPGPRYQD